MDSDKEESKLCSFTHDLDPLLLEEYTETNLDSDKDESKLCSFTHDLDPKKEVKKKMQIKCHLYSTVQTNSNNHTLKNF